VTGKVTTAKKTRKQTITCKAYSKSNTSPILKRFLSRIDELVMPHGNGPTPRPSASGGV
jgi:hypothetical protein